MPRKGNYIETYERTEDVDSKTLIAQVRLWREQGNVCEGVTDGSGRVVAVNIFEGSPDVRGTLLYGAAKPGCEEYYGFGAYTHRTVHFDAGVKDQPDEVIIYCIGSEDSGWMVARLMSGLMAVTLECYEREDDLFVWLRDWFGCVEMEDIAAGEGLAARKAEVPL